MKLLFLCTYNRCRSIIAEAVTRQVCGTLVEVQSAGSRPARKVHPLTLENLAMHNIPVRGLRAKSWDLQAGFNPDFVITVCEAGAMDACPLLDGKATPIHWGFADPSLLVDDAVACYAAFDALIGTLELRMKKVRDLLLRQCDKQTLAEELYALAACHTAGTTASGPGSYAGQSASAVA